MVSVIPALLSLGILSVMVIRLRQRSEDRRLHAAQIDRDELHRRLADERTARLDTYEIVWREQWAIQVEQLEAATSARLLLDAAHDNALKMDSQHNPQRRAVDMTAWRLHA